MQADYIYMADMPRVSPFYDVCSPLVCVPAVYMHMFGADSVINVRVTCQLVWS